MNLGVVGAIVRKDLVALTRDQFYLFITIIGLIAFVAMYWLLPSSVDETVRLGVYHSDLDTALGPLTAIETEALAIERYDSPEALAVAVEEGSDGIVAGMAFSEDFVAQAQSGSASVDLLVPAGLPPEYAEFMNGLAAQVGYFVSGTTPPVDVSTRIVVLGTDRVGDQVSMQEQMLPLLAFFVLMMETFALASLVSVEVQLRTVTAVLVTPARARDFITAKGVIGTLLALAEVMLLLVLIRGFVGDVPVLLVALLLGAVLVTGIGLLAGASGKDFMGVLFLSMTLMIPLMIPAFGALFPGTAAAWIRVLPTYGLVEAIVGVTTRGESWSDLGGVLLLLGAWGFAIFALGSAVLRRRVATI